MPKPDLDDRELATVLGALRTYQIAMAENLPHNIDDIVSDGGTLKPLTDAEIDALCERLNT